MRYGPLIVGVLVVLARSLLGSGATSFPRLDPPATAAWTRAAGGAIISPVVAWEQTAVYEPSVLVDSTGWRMWYDGGWNNPAVGYASCHAGSDPTVAGNWTKYASNPVYGQGGSGYANGAASTEVILVGTTLYLFTSGSTTPSTGLRSTFRVATSAQSDGLVWATQTSSISFPSGGTLWGNRTVWLEGSSWYLLQEVYNGTIWQIYYYTSSDGLTWSIGNSGNALTTLQVHAGGMYGGPYLVRQGATYVLYYHAAPGSGVTPTDIYRATSTDRVTWTISPAGAVLTHTGATFEVDQVADPGVLTAGTVAYLFYDGIDNPHSAGKIGVATDTAAP